MTGTPWEIALATDGKIAVPSWASITRTLAPWEMRFSTLLACVSADDLASFETYGAAAGLDRRLHRRLVPLRPALFLVVVPGHADDAVAAGGRGAAARRGVGRARRRSVAPARRGRRGGAGCAASIVIIVVAAGDEYQCRAHDERSRTTDVHADPFPLCEWRTPVDPRDPLHASRTPWSRCIDWTRRRERRSQNPAVPGSV